MDATVSPCFNGGMNAVLSSIPWYGWVAIVAIVSGALTAIVRASYQHQQRMAMIRQGMNPGVDED